MVDNEEEAQHFITENKIIAEEASQHEDKS